MKILGTDVTELAEMVGEELHPGFPVASTRPIEQHDGNDARLAGFASALAPQIPRPSSRSAGKKREGVRFLHEVQFPGEKIMKFNQLGIAFDDRIRTLLKCRRMLRPNPCSRPAPFWAAPMMRRRHR